jgi:hypothetical protein
MKALEKQLPQQNPLNTMKITGPRIVNLSGNRKLGQSLAYVRVR